MASCPHAAGKESCPSSSSSSSSSAAGESEYRGVYYGGYLALDQLLSAQRPLTKCHDEVLFIITHQAFELWFKQMILEIGSVIDIFNQPIVPESAMLLAVRRLNRVAEIQRVCVQQFKIMETMTPMEFVDFRDALVPASGFQSYQFREFEVRFGLLEENRTKLRGCRFLGVFLPEHEEYLKEAIKLPNLFSVVEKWLERTPFLDIPEWNFWDEYKAAVHKVIQRDRDHADDEWRINDASGKNESNEETKKELQALEERFQAIFDPELYEKQRESGQVRLSQRAFKAALLIMLYRQEPLLHLPFEFLEMLIEIDNNVSLFRHAHATMVHRMIGARMGTGGSSGVHYLRSTTGLKYKVFGDLTNVSTYTIPSQSLPALPPNVRAKMNFSNLS